MAHISNRLKKLSELTLNTGKVVGGIPIQLDSWWRLHGERYWYDGFASKSFKGLEDVDFKQRYKKALHMLSDMPQQIKALKLKPRDLKGAAISPEMLKKALTEYERMIILLKESEKQYNDVFNPYTTKDAEIKAAFEKADYVDDYDKYIKAYEKWKHVDVPSGHTKAVKSLERQFDLYIEDARSALLKLGRGATKGEKDALSHVGQITQMFKMDPPNYQTILNTLIIVEGDLGKVPKGEKGSRIQGHIQKATDGVKAILKTSVDFWSKIKKPDRAKRPKYVDFALGLTKEQKELYDDWWTELLKISYGLNGISTDITNQVLLLNRRRPKGIKPSLPKNPTTWHEKLDEIATKVLESPDGLEQWTDDQLAKLKLLVTPKNRLLHDETMGIVELPVLLARGYIAPEGFLELKKQNFVIDRALGSYQVISNALLMGIKASEVSNLTEMGAAFSKMAAAVTDPELKARLKILRPSGPVIRKDKHYYAVLIPMKTFDSYHFEKWDIQPKAHSGV